MHGRFVCHLCGYEDDCFSSDDSVVECPHCHEHSFERQSNILPDDLFPHQEEEGVLQ